MISYCKKNPMVVLAIVSAIVSVIMFFVGRAYEQGCKDTTVQQVSEAQAEQFLDIKDIKSRVGTIETNAAVTANKVTNIENILNKWLVPKQVADAR
jgi:transcriptional regulator of heat shock response